MPLSDAEKIAEEVVKKLHTPQNSYLEHVQFELDTIATALREYGDAREKNLRNEIIDLAVAGKEETLLTMVYNKALEEAAKTAEEFTSLQFFTYGQMEEKEMIIKIRKKHRQEIAHAIRALSRKAGG